MVNLPEFWLSTGKKEIIDYRFTKVSSCEYINKPIGGLWCSPYTPSNKYLSAWHEWCVNKDFNLSKCENGIIIKLKQNVKIAIIDNLNDLKRFFKLVGYYNSNIVLSDLMVNKTLDYSELSKLYDIVYLTENGLHDTNFFLHEEYNMSGWDVESACIMNINVIENYKTISLKEKNNAII